ncbi:hypothetical protein GCM10010399_32330 [Dactylosporangium fulvum]
MLRVSGSLHAGGRRENGRVEVTLGESRAGGFEDCYGEFSGSHRQMLSGVDSGTWRRPVVLVTMRDGIYTGTFAFRPDPPTVDQTRPDERADR